MQVKVAETCWTRNKVGISPSVVRRKKTVAARQRRIHTFNGNESERMTVLPRARSAYQAVGVPGEIRKEEGGVAGVVGGGHMRAGVQPCFLPSLNSRVVDEHAPA